MRRCQVQCGERVTTAAQVMREWQPGGSSEAQKLLEAEAVSLVRVSRSPEDMQQAMANLHARLASIAAAAAPDRMPSAALPARGGHSISSNT